MEVLSNYVPRLSFFTFSFYLFYPYLDQYNPFYSNSPCPPVAIDYRVEPFYSIVYAVA